MLGRRCGNRLEIDGCACKKEPLQIRHAILDMKKQTSLKMLGLQVNIRWEKQEGTIRRERQGTENTITEDFAVVQ